MDQIYNIYDLKAETRNIPESVSWWFNHARNWFNHKAYPYVIEHRREINDANKFSWKVTRDPESGDVDFVAVRPTETLVARHIREISSRYWSLFPIAARRRLNSQFLNVIGGGVSESMCYITDDSVFTFDGAGYNYTLDGCQHVLMTDCWKLYNVVIMARQDGKRKIVTVISGLDFIVIDPVGKVSLKLCSVHYFSFIKNYKGFMRYSVFLVRLEDSWNMLLILLKIQIDANINHFKRFNRDSRII